MIPCSLIQDLLPLYADDALSPDSRQLVSDHLATCRECRHSLAALRRAPDLPNPGPDSPAPPDEARFLTKLKRQAGTALGLTLTLILVVSLGSVQYGKWSRDREWGRAQRAELAAQSQALQRLWALSPASEPLMQANGLRWTANAMRAGEELLVDWQILIDRHTAGVERISPTRAVTVEVQAFDPVTGKELHFGPGSGNGSYEPGYAAGSVRRDLKAPGPVRVRLTAPALIAYKPLPEPVSFDFRRPEGDGEVELNQEVSLHGIRFLIERVAFHQTKITVEYRQLTNPAEVGYHFLPIQLSDRLGTHTGGMLESLPDPLRPTARFDSVNSPSQNWRITIPSIALAIPALLELGVK